MSTAQSSKVLQYGSITVANRCVHPPMSFEEYQALDGWSYSGIKAYDKPFGEPTAKMRIGTLVHAYLLEPSTYNHEHRNIVIPAANAVKHSVGALLPFLKCEASITADFTAHGLTLQYRGRIDMLMANRIVLDLKVSEMPLDKSIPFFGYDKQITGYQMASGCPIGIIIRVCPKKFTTETKIIKKNVDWWADQVIKFGSPLAQ